MESRREGDASHLKMEGIPKKGSDPPLALSYDDGACYDDYDDY